MTTDTLPDPGNPDSPMSRLYDCWLEVAPDRGIRYGEATADDFRSSVAVLRIEQRRLSRELADVRASIRLRTRLAEHLDAHPGARLLDAPEVTL